MDVPCSEDGTKPDGPKFDEWQYDFLKKCSEKREEGIKEWNEWRRQNPLQDVLLEGASLQYWWLCGINWGGLSPERVPLTGGNKASFVYLSGARLYGSHLEGANLERAYLNMASLHRAHLEKANLSYVRYSRLSRPDS